MQRACRHFRATWWYNALFFRSVSMIVNNVWAIRKSLGINERVEDVRALIADYLLCDLKKTFDDRYGVYDNLGVNYVPLYRRSRKDLNNVRLDGCNDHFPVCLKGVYRGCAYHRNGSKTNNYCSKCKVHLHRNECYRKWHIQKHIK